jgi:hypothetical protein
MGVTAFPHDLLNAERERSAVYRELAPAGPRRTTALRRRLLRLSVRVWFHPYWDTRPPAVPAARELRRRARGDDGVKRTA